MASNNQIAGMNALCTARCVLMENRWHLLLTVIAIGLGYLMGRYCCSPDKSSDDYTNAIITSDGGGGGDGNRLSADCLRKIVSKIDEIASSVEQLREYVSS